MKNKKLIPHTCTALLVLLLVTGITGCQKENTASLPEGTESTESSAEKLQRSDLEGENIDMENLYEKALEDGEAKPFYEETRSMK